MDDDGWDAHTAPPADAAGAEAGGEAAAPVPAASHALHDEDDEDAWDLGVEEELGDDALVAVPTDADVAAPPEPVAEEATPEPVAVEAAPEPEPTQEPAPEPAQELVEAPAASPPRRQRRISWADNEGAQLAQRILYESEQPVEAEEAEVAQASAAAAAAAAPQHKSLRSADTVAPSTLRSASPPKKKKGRNSPSPTKRAGSPSKRSGSPSAGGKKIFYTGNAAAKKKKGGGGKKKKAARAAAVKRVLEEEGWSDEDEGSESSDEGSDDGDDSDGSVEENIRMAEVFNSKYFTVKDYDYRNSSLIDDENEVMGHWMSAYGLKVKELEAAVDEIQALKKLVRAKDEAIEDVERKLAMEEQRNNLSRSDMIMLEKLENTMALKMKELKELKEYVSDLEGQLRMRDKALKALAARMEDTLEKEAIHVDRIHKLESRCHTQKAQLQELETAKRGMELTCARQSKELRAFDKSTKSNTDERLTIDVLRAQIRDLERMVKDRDSDIRKLQLYCDHPNRAYPRLNVDNQRVRKASMLNKTEQEEELDQMEHMLREEMEKKDQLISKLRGRVRHRDQRIKENEKTITKLETRLKHLKKAADALAESGANAPSHDDRPKHRGKRSMEVESRLFQRTAASKGKVKRQSKYGTVKF